MNQYAHIDKGPTQKVRMKMVPEQQPILPANGDLGILTKGKGLSQPKGNDRVISLLGGKSIQGIESLLRIKDKGIHQKHPTVTPHQSEDPPEEVDLKIKLKSKVHSVKRRFEEPENICSSFDSTGCHYSNQGKLKSVMDVCVDFNNECGPDVDIPLDSQISESDMKIENFKGPKLYTSKGSFGSTFHLKTKADKDIVVKEIVRRDFTNMNYKEIQTPMALSGKGIVKIFGLKRVRNILWILMEDAGKSLRMWLSDKHDHSFQCWSKEPRNLLNMAKQLFKIIAVLEKHGIVHRDIKPENLCAMCKNEQWIFTLIDFGSAQPASDKAVFAGHTVEYLPPKLNALIYKYNESPFTVPQDIFFEEKCDVWGIAMVILTTSNRGFHPIPLVNSYTSQDVNLQRKRVMEMIIKLKEKPFENFVSKTTEPLKTVLEKTLMLKRFDAWTARKACTCLEGDEYEQRVHFKEPRLSTGLLKQAQQQPQDVFNNNSFKMILKLKGNPFANNSPNPGKSQSPSTTTVVDGNAGPGAGRNSLSTLGVTTKPAHSGIVEPVKDGGKLFTSPQKFVGIGNCHGRINTQHRMICRGRLTTETPAPLTVNQSTPHIAFGDVGRSGHNNQGFVGDAKRNICNMLVNAHADYSHSNVPHEDKGNSGNIPNFMRFDEPDKTVKMVGVQQMNEDEDSSFSFESPLPNLDVLMPDNWSRKFLSGQRRNSHNKQ